FACLERRAECLCARLRPGRGTVDEADLLRLLVLEAHQHRPRPASGPDYDDRAGVGAPVWMSFQNALDVAEAVVVVAVERAVGRNYDAIDGADAPRQRFHTADNRECCSLVRNRQVAAVKAQRRKRAQRRAKPFGWNGERNVSSVDPILAEPEIVNFG